MDQQDTDTSGPARQARLLTTLEGLLAIQTLDVKSALTQASEVVAEVLRADKADVFLYEPGSHSLVAVGTSNTPMGQRQLALGLGRQPLANGGKTVGVFQTGNPYHSGRVDQDSNELRGVRE